MAMGVGLGVGLAMASSFSDQRGSLLQKAMDWFSASQNSIPHLWASLSLASEKTITESRTGTSFLAVLYETQQLVGIGIRKKSIIGIKNINVYAFGIYADASDMKEALYEKYRPLSADELKENKDFYGDIMDSDISMTVRLEIVYGRLSIASVRSAFEETVGSRLQKFSGADNKELLQRFTTQFKDEYKLPRGTIIDLSRQHGHILQTKINGEVVGSVQSQLLCKSIFDLYIGEDPFDRDAKQEIGHGLASLLKN
ncbi:fatty-acid-binding protein 1 [Amborella trichopoda]|uniref:Chalcone isomerase domain-containing protein n=1 Tax=Amborella trichopoda TaxID=13333 RepID=W1NZN4_AMBTC|nr:fatty-acid-binding protein 1 [Amborella trichopoda]ERN00819.1 hypothetical protein AMTR_s00103p00049220 [Amborella trichopoda]|eukprot:XP_006838250.1 fatty-acid-binding protein 1 [Amborella trichopoda]